MRLNLDWINKLKCSEIAIQNEADLQLDPVWGSGKSQSKSQSQSKSVKRAAVMICISALDNSMLFAVRSSKLSSHAGETAFPGGMEDVTDTCIWDTAEREAEEELALDRADVQRVTMVRSRLSRHKVQVYPAVYVTEKQLQPVPDQQEIVDSFSVPIPWLLEHRKTTVDTFNLDSGQVVYPRWNYKKYTIWGLTAYIAATVLKHAWDTEFDFMRG